MAECAWCTTPKTGLAMHWKRVGDFWFCPDHKQDAQIAHIIEQATTCVYCKGERPRAAADWHDSGGSWYCPGCWRLESGDASGISACVRSDIAAARRLIRACDEIDDRYQRLTDEDAAQEAKPWREVIGDIGRALNDMGGEASMRIALLLVRADADPDHLVTAMAGGTEMDPARTSTVQSHASYIGREWTGIGSWQG